MKDEVYYLLDEGMAWICSLKTLPTHDATVGAQLPHLTVPTREKVAGLFEELAAQLRVDLHQVSDASLNFMQACVAFVAQPAFADEDDTPIFHSDFALAILSAQILAQAASWEHSSQKMSEQERDTLRNLVINAHQHVERYVEAFQLPAHDAIVQTAKVTEAAKAENVEAVYNEIAVVVPCEAIATAHDEMTKVKTPEIADETTTEATRAKLALLTQFHVLDILARRDLTDSAWQENLMGQCHHMAQNNIYEFIHAVTFLPSSMSITVRQPILDIYLQRAITITEAAAQDKSLTQPTTDVLITVVNNFTTMARNHTDYDGPLGDFYDATANVIMKHGTNHAFHDLVAHVSAASIRELRKLSEKMRKHPNMPVRSGFVHASENAPALQQVAHLH
jgi:hypothetical protein